VRAVLGRAYPDQRSPFFSVSGASFIASIAWPTSVLIIALLFRKLRDRSTPQLQRNPKRRAVLHRVESSDRKQSRLTSGVPPSISRGEIGGAAGRLAEIAEASPTGAIVET
jgi:hypothetical protein